MANAYTGGGTAQAAMANVRGASAQTTQDVLGDGNYSKGEVLRRIAGFAKPELPIFILSFVASIASVIMQLYVPILIGEAIDTMVETDSLVQAELLQILIRIACFAVTAASLQWASSFGISYVCAKTIESLRVASFSQFKSMSVSFIDTHAQGDLMSRVVADVDAVGDGLLQGLTQLTGGIVTIFGTIFFMMRLSIWVALLVLVMTPLSVIAAGLISKFSQKRFRAQQALQGKLAAYAEEAIYAHDLLQSFNQTKRIEAEFRKTNDELLREGEMAQFVSSLTNPTTRLVNNITYAAVALFGISCILTSWPQTLSIGEVQSFLVYANQYMRPFNEISATAVQVESAFASGRRLLALLDATPEVRDAKGAYVLENARGEIELQKVYFSYTKDKKLLQDINLYIKAGERVALVGPTGCGKTTLLSLLLRFYETDSGKILLDGHDIREVTKESLRASFGMVLQDSWLFEASILDNIRFGKPDASLDEVVAAAKRAHADSFIQQLPDGYHTLYSPEHSSLSQGQKQLICLARVMLLDPAVLLLDEATSNIDTRTEMQVQAAFDEMMKDRTSLVVAHRLSTIEASDRIVVMDAGKIVQMGTHAELLAAEGLYKELYMSQFAAAAKRGA